MATEELHMEIQSLIFGSNQEKLKCAAEHLMLDMTDKSKMALVREISEKLDETLSQLEDGEVIPYLQELKMMFKPTSVQKTTKKSEIKAETSDNPVDKLLTTSAFRRQFKINGQIGEPHQQEKLSFTSLVRQIQTGISQGYTEDEIVDGIIRAITPGMILQRYLETFKDLSLDRLKKVLRSHYGVKNYDCRSRA